MELDFKKIDLQALNLGEKEGDKATLLPQPTGWKMLVFISQTKWWNANKQLLLLGLC